MNSTRVIILGTLIALGLYDAWVCTAGNTDISISQFVVNMCNQSPVAYGVIMLLIGHFGFLMTPKFKDGKKKMNSIITLLMLTVQTHTPTATVTGLDDTKV